LLSGKTFPALTSKLALVGQTHGGSLGAVRRSGTPLAIGFSERISPLILPPLHPSPLAGLPSDFTTPRSLHRSPDALLRASPALASPPCSDRPTSQNTHRPPPTFGEFFKSSAHGCISSDTKPCPAKPVGLPEVIAIKQPQGEVLLFADKDAPPDSDPKSLPRSGFGSINPYSEPARWPRPWLPPTPFRRSNSGRAGRRAWCRKVLLLLP